jgi:hypothetical protein
MQGKERARPLIATEPSEEGAKATQGGLVALQRQQQIMMEALLALFDPNVHRHAMAFDDMPRGTEST